MEKCFVGRKKRRNAKEKGTEMKRGKKKKMKTCETYENLNIENCLNKG